MSRFFIGRWFRIGGAGSVTAGLVIVAMVGAPRRAAAQATAAGWYGAGVSITEEAVDGFTDTRFKPGRAVSGGMGFRFQSGLLSEFHIGQFDMRLTERGADLGRLRVSRVMLGRVGYQGNPSGPGVSGHIHVGAGFARVTKWENGPGITQLERQFGARMAVDTGDDQFVFELGGGPDLFVNKYLAITTDLRLVLMNVSTAWFAVGRRTVQLDGVERFFASTFQGQVGMRIFLH